MELWGLEPQTPALQKPCRASFLSILRYSPSGTPRRIDRNRPQYWTALDQRLDQNVNGKCQVATVLDPFCGSGHIPIVAA